MTFHIYALNVSHCSFLTMAYLFVSYCLVSIKISVCHVTVQDIFSNLFRLVIAQRNYTYNISISNLSDNHIFNNFGFDWLQNNELALVCLPNTIPN